MQALRLPHDEYLYSGLTAAPAAEGCPGLLGIARIRREKSKTQKKTNSGNIAAKRKASSGAFRFLFLMFPVPRFLGSPVFSRRYLLPLSLAFSLSSFPFPFLSLCDRVPCGPLRAAGTQTAKHKPKRCTPFFGGRRKVLFMGHIGEYTFVVERGGSARRVQNRRAGRAHSKEFSIFLEKPCQIRTDVLL